MTQYEITVPIRRPWVALLLFPLILPFRPFLGVVLLLLRGIFRPQSPAEFFSGLILGVPFTLVGFFFARAWLRGILICLFGRETLKLEEGRLMLRGSLFGAGRWRTYPVDSIRGIRGGRLDLQQEIAHKSIGMKLEDLMRLHKGFGWTEEIFQFLGLWPALIFQSGGTLQWFGLGVEESQAQEIFARLRMHLPESAFQKIKEK